MSASCACAPRARCSICSPLPALAACSDCSTVRDLSLWEDIAHYNAPTFYRALERPSTKRFGEVCAYAFGILSMLYLTIMLMGHRCDAKRIALKARGSQSAAPCLLLITRGSLRAYRSSCSSCSSIASCPLPPRTSHRSTFGDVTASNILKNYAERDSLAVVGRFATFASILFGTRRVVRASRPWPAG